MRKIQTQPLLKFVIPTSVKRARVFGSPFTPVFGVNGQGVPVARRDLVLSHREDFISLYDGHSFTPRLYSRVQRRSEQNARSLASIHALKTARPHDRARG